MKENSTGVGISRGRATGATLPVPPGDCRRGSSQITGAAFGARRGHRIQHQKSERGSSEANRETPAASGQARRPGSSPM